MSDPAPVGAVVPTSVGGSRRPSGARWGIALLITAAVLGITSAGLVLLSAGAATSALVSWVPPDSYGYVEIRLDAPGDQRQNVANVLSKFPGFADQANLGFKIDEALDQLLGRLGPGVGTFSRGIRPWLGDSIALAATRLPDRTSGASVGPGAVWLVATRDPVAARAWLQGVVGPDAPTTTHAGVELRRLLEGSTPIVVGVVGNAIIGGDEASVHAAIDTGGASTFPHGATFRDAIAAIAGDRVAYAFLDVRRLTALLQAAAPATPAPAASGLLSLEMLPAWLAVVVRAESDAMTATLAIPAANLSPTNASRSSALAPHLPPTTLGAVELHDLGDAMLAALSAVRESADGRSIAEQIDQALRALGGAEQLVGWIGDGSVALLSNGDRPPDAGLLIRAKDAQQARNRLLQVRNLVALVGGTQGIEIRDEVLADGTTITVYDLGAASQFGADQLPIAVGDRLLVAVAQRDDLVVIGLGSTFARSVLDTASGASLAAEDRYRAALNRAGESNAAQVYLDIPRLLELVVEAMPTEDQAFYRREIAPYVEPLQAFAASASSGDRSRVRLVITVK